jgi:hypothetical protein
MGTDFELPKKKKKNLSIVTIPHKVMFWAYDFILLGLETFVKICIEDKTPSP